MRPPLPPLRELTSPTRAQVEVYQRGFDEADGSLGLLMRKAEDLAAVENGLQAEVDGLRKMTEEGRSFTQSNYLRMKGSSSRPSRDRTDPASSGVRGHPVSPLYDPAILHLHLNHTAPLLGTSMHPHAGRQG